MRVTAQLLVRMPPQLKRQLDRIVKRDGNTTLNREAVEALRKYVAEREALQAPAE